MQHPAIDPGDRLCQKELRESEASYTEVKRTAANTIPVRRAFSIEKIQIISVFYFRAAP